MRAQALLLLILPVAACGRGESNIIRGTVEMDQVDIAPQQPARVLKMLVNEGDAVAPGDTIAILGLADASAQVSAREARVRQAEAAVRDLKAGARPQEIARAESELQAAEAEATRTATELERARALVRDTVISRRDYDAAAAAAQVAAERRDAARNALRLLQAGTRPAQIRAAEAELAQARADLAGTGSRLADLVLVSPVAGVVLTRAAEPGEVLSAGIPAAIVGDTSRRYVRAYVPQRLLDRLKPGAHVLVTPDGWKGSGVGARVTSIQPEAEFTPRVSLTPEERADQLFGARLALDSPLPVGLWVTVSIETESADYADSADLTSP
ncbi:MAG TPA: HlyD family efflux transporter periplasmic adaptor subunit [Gemmatimonadales bacterium]|nr:HlyD family efflux transporter periplasmic adaptor subunit [Gemmatimonadales bacterium]